jgi:hypothetical protein
MKMKKLMVFVLLAGISATGFARNKLPVMTYDSVVLTFSSGSSELNSAEIERLQRGIKSAQSKGKIDKIDVAVWSDKDHPVVGTLSENDENLADHRIDSIKTAIKKNYNRYERVKSYNMTGNASWLGQNLHTDEAKLDAVFAKNEKGSLAREDFNIIKREGAPSRAVIILKIKE